MIYVVLGMHKSGTTLVSQILHQSGVSMVDVGDDPRDYDKGNQWERESTKQLNHEWLQSAEKFSLLARVPAAGIRNNPCLVGKMSNLVDYYNSRSQDWGFKDPRTVLVFDQWLKVLPQHAIVAIYRRPEDVWSHYWSSTRGRRRLTVVRNFLACWCDYNQALINVIRHSGSKSLVISYSKLMQGRDEFSRLEAFVGRSLQDERRAALNRNSSSPSRLYKLIEKWHTLKTGQSPQKIFAELECLAATTN